MPRKRSRWADRPLDLVIRGVLSAALAMPYERRVPFVGGVTARLLAPLAGWPDRVKANLRHVRPDLAPDEVRRIWRAVSDNAGRTLIEIYSGREFVARLGDAPIEGPGLEAFEATRREGRPAILVTGHFGNFTAPRVALAARGHRIAGLYRPMRNVPFNRHYAAALASLGEPMFASDRRGLAQVLKHLRGGGAVGLLVDVHANDGAPLSFFGKTAPTALSAAELALKYRAPLIPFYGLRQPDGLGFRIVSEAPVPPSDPATMMQGVNDSLERQVRTHMGQWFWVHRRWKPERQRARAAASTGP